MSSDNILFSHPPTQQNVAGARKQCESLSGKVVQLGQTEPEGLEKPEWLKKCLSGKTLEIKTSL